MNVKLERIRHTRIVRGNNVFRRELVGAPLRRYERNISGSKVVLHTVIVELIVYPLAEAN